MKGYQTISKLTPIKGPLKDDYELYDLLESLKVEVIKLLKDNFKVKEIIVEEANS